MSGSLLPETWYKGAMKITLSQRARTNDGKEHTACVVPSTSDLPQFRGRPILRIEGTGGSWYLSTFFEEDEPLPEQIYIDFDRGYACVNFRAVLVEAIHKLAKRPL